MPRFKNRIIFCLQIWLLLAPLLSYAQEAKIPTFEELCPNGLKKLSPEQEKRLDMHDYLVREERNFIDGVLQNKGLSTGWKEYHIIKKLDSDPKHRRLEISKEDTSWQCRDFTWHKSTNDSCRVLGLNWADLSSVQLQGANLTCASLQEAQLYLTQLQGANLSFAELQGAYFFNANIQRANLRSTKLGGVDFQNADISYACLAKADFTDNGESIAYSKPNVANARGLEKVLFDYTDDCDSLSNNQEGKLAPWTNDGQEYGNNNPPPLIKGIAHSPTSLFEDLAPIGFYPLATELRQKGYVEQARRITYAYKHNEQRYLLYELGRLWHGKQYYESVLTSFKYIIYLAFDFTTNWGMHPFLALKHLGYLILFGGFFYSLGAVTKGNVLKIKICNRFLPPKPTRKEGEYSFYNLTDYVGMRGSRESQPIRILRLSLWISTINSLRIGWKDLDLGTWLSQMHPKQITFETNGWMHTFLIMQSIIGKYFLVSFLLTFFGAPFNNW